MVQKKVYLRWMKKIIVGCFLFFVNNCFAQQITFQRTIGGTNTKNGYSVQQTSDGGYIIAGYTNSFGAGSFDIYLIKTDVNGNALWTKTFGGTDNDRGYSVQQTSDGGYIIVGETYSFGAGNYDVCLIKVDSNGNAPWTKTFGGASDDKGYCVRQSIDGGYIIAGKTLSFGAGNYDVYLIKTDSNGGTLWTKTYGGTAGDYGTSIRQSVDGGYIISGYTYSFGAGNYDVYLIKTDSIGNLLWTKTLGGINDDQGYSVQQTTDGGYVIGGYTGSFGAGDDDVYLIKTDVNGGTLWTKTFGGTDIDVGYSVQQVADGGYIIAGETENLGIGGGDVYLIKTNSNGDSLWTRAFGGPGYDIGNSVQQTMDGQFIITGIFGNFGADIYLIKTDSLGNSGCNQSTTTTMVTTPSTQVTNPPTVVTYPPTIVTTPTIITGSGGAVTTLCTTVGMAPISNFLSSILNISPNPATNNFTITFPNTIYKGVIEIYNVLGENVFTEDIFNVSQKEIHINNINAGIYFVKVRDGEKEYSKKLMIE
jgi:hypothetical protein